MQPDHSTAVLVVGGGIAGLSAALFLARRGVATTLVERHSATAIMPKARAFNPRSMEIYRALGLERAIRDRTSILADKPTMIGARTLAGAERFRVDLLTPGQTADLSPTDWAMVDQDELERVVRDQVERADADVRFGTELVSFETEPDGVVAVVRPHDGGGEQRIRATYLIAADGNRSGVRARLGIGTDGPGVLSHAAHFIFDADLDAAVRGRRFLLAYSDEPTPGTALAPLRTEGRWMLGVPFDPDDGETVADFTEQRCVESVRRAVGIAEIDPVLVPPAPGWERPLMHVTIGGWVAQRYRAGPVFLVGDAAHVVPPTGSYGANTGIADAHNLAWKLAAVLHDHAGDALLDSYADERLPVATATLQQAMRLLTARHSGTADDLAALDDTAMIFGYRYASTAVHADGPTPAGLVVDPRVPTGRPGLRAPHVWLDRDGTTVSTIDLFSAAFTLLTGPDGDGWAEAARTVSAELGVDVQAHRVGVDLRDPEDGFLRRYGIGADGCSLVRPDGFVAWRATTATPRPHHELCRILRRLLQLSSPT